MMKTLRRLAPWGVALVLGLCATCTFKVDPDKGRFSCASEADCGTGFECRPQVSGGGLCYRPGECSDEVCDGQDNDCDGVADDNLCAPGATCLAGGGCVETSCGDGLDNDSNGRADCLDPSCLGVACSSADFNCGLRFVDAGPPPPMRDAGDDGGVDGGELDGGEPDGGAIPVPSCVRNETECGDSADNDGDGKADCADTHCEGHACGDGGTCSQGQCR